MRLWGQEPQTYEDTGNAEESLLNLRKSIQPAPQPTERMQPRDGPLHEPAEHAQTTAMLRVALGQHGDDPQPTQQLPDRFGVITAIALQPFGFLPLGSRLATDGGHTRQDIEDLRDLVDVGGCYGRGQGNALAIGHHMVLAARLAPIRGIGARVLAPFRRLGEGSVDQGTFPVDQVRAVEFGQQQGMQPDPDAGLVPGLQVMSAGLAATAAQFGRQVVPGHTGLEDEENAGENLAVIQGLASGKPEAALCMWRQQRRHPLPDCVGNEQLHGRPSSGPGYPSPDHQAAARVPNDSFSSFFPNALREAYQFL